ncbi:MAG: peptidylprolyl isomerase [Oscillospiraceae bacterium]
MIKNNKLKKGDTTVTLKTSMGDIKIVLFNDIAPKTVENFVTHCKNGYYNNILFHRVMNDFMIQCGDPTATGMGGESIWGTTFEDEINDNAIHLRGSLSMANSGPNTNGSQFFIVQANNFDERSISQIKKSTYTEDIISAYKENGGTPWLDGKHTVFGIVYDGLNIVDDIAKVKTDMSDKPLDDILILSTIVEIAK